jgi:capsular exopolysaccharide synthesis family protein
MDPVQYLQGLKRRWPVVLVTAAIAVAAGWFTTKAVPATQRRAPGGYSATVLMIGNRSQINLELYATLTTVGEVPRRVAAKINYKGDPRQLGQRVSVSSSKETGLFRITARSPNPDEAKLLANTFAAELLQWRRDRLATDAENQLNSTRQRMDQLKNEIAQLDARIQQGGPQLEVVRAERNAKIEQFGSVSRSYQELSTRPPAQVGFEIIDSSPAFPNAAPENQGAPDLSSRSTRVATAAVIGLLAGVGLALMLERFDTRIRTRQQAQEQFGLPVLAEIPKVRWRSRSALRAVGRRRDSRVDDSFRVLAAAVMQRQPRPKGHAKGELPVNGASRTILVTSATEGEGKTTVVANLATTFAAMGRSVTALSCDFRRPALHSMFRMRNNWGLTDVLRSADPSIIGNGKRTAQARGVSVVPTGPVPVNAAELLSSPRMIDVLNYARSHFEVVLIDSAPILTGDAPHLFEVVDSVLVVARAGVTIEELAEWAADLLIGLDAPVMGLAFNATTEFTTPRYYTPRKMRRRRRGNARVARPVKTH